MPSLHLDYAGIRWFIPEEWAGLPIEEVGWSVRLTERVEAAGAVKLADLSRIDLEAIVPPASSAAAQVFILVNVFRAHWHRCR